MSAPDNFYITTTLPYVNARPHMGHAVEFVRADIIARYHALMGDNVFFNTGTDEHGLKIYRKAEEEGKDPQEYVDEQSAHFKRLIADLSMMPDTNFVRTTDEFHTKAAQKFWERCYENGDIYKETYKTLYCVGCELEKSLSDLEGGRCPEHPDKELEEIDEENYFFRFSKYQNALLDLYENTPDFVVPHFRLKEVKSFVERGLEDFSISRLKEKQPWGVPVPNDPDHTMYVWFDALVNYISVIGWPENMDTFEKWWPVTQYAGKDNLRQQAAMWQAMLLSAGLPPSRRVVINGFIISGGQKMSKSLGNVIDPYDLMNEFGVDALRYYIAREVQPFEDSDMTLERFKEVYNANLANGLGNAASRLTVMADKYDVEYGPLPEKHEVLNAPELTEAYHQHFTTFEMNKAADHIWKRIGDIDMTIEQEQPFKKIKTDPDVARKDIASLIHSLWEVAVLLEPFMAETAEKLQTALIDRERAGSLFQRKE